MEWAARERVCVPQFYFPFQHRFARAFFRFFLNIFVFLYAYNAMWWDAGLPWKRFNNDTSAPETRDLTYYYKYEMYCRTHLTKLNAHIAKGPGCLVSCIRPMHSNACEMTEYEGFTQGVTGFFFLFLYFSVENGKNLYKNAQEKSIRILWWALYAPFICLPLPPVFWWTSARSQHTFKNMRSNLITTYFVILVKWKYDMELHVHAGTIRMAIWKGFNLRGQNVCI